MLTPEQVKTHWWRGALVVTAVTIAAAFAREAPFAAVFALVPVLLWCSLARSPRNGVVVGLVLLALLAWFVVPRELDLSGPWVPAKIEVYWLYTTLAAVVCAIGARRGAGRLTALVVAGFVVTGGVLFSEWEAPPGDEGVSPGPAQLRIVESIGCGSGNCWREMAVTGDYAADVLRAHLTARDFIPAPSAGDRRIERFCRDTGLLVTHTVCADLYTFTETSARVDWYVN
ncbi:hypothetical protein DMA12_12290 [Amycolatopsis balhimycina DSM 5908]|uniref:Uncharacterized protein n=1 Tax=Amycolatopsis balhimycina DSM 5908 TaxID=1081091 RepID=A0A428WSL7_AMYBA|nr:hypothetical protein [Amycolatopsis balhimycina]RSM46058.1 hypothetical protein DMA12_12290 [Amycolatopsis balhimycina DSM 5908]